MLAHLRNGDTYARLAAGFGIGLATVYRYIREAVALLAGLGRSLTAALWALACTHSNVALLDGTLVRTHRIRIHDRRYDAGKHRHHGVNLPGLTDPSGRLIWIFDGRPGSTHDLTAARTHHVVGVADRAGRTSTPTPSRLNDPSQAGTQRASRIIRVNSSPGP